MGVKYRILGLIIVSIKPFFSGGMMVVAGDVLEGTFSDGNNSSFPIQSGLQPERDKRLESNNMVRNGRRSRESEVVFEDGFESGDLSNWDIQGWNEVPFGITTEDNLYGSYGRSVGSRTWGDSCFANHMVGLEDTI